MVFFQLHKPHEGPGVRSPPEAQKDLGGPGFDPRSPPKAQTISDGGSGVRSPPNGPSAAWGAWLGFDPPLPTQNLKAQNLFVVSRVRSPSPKRGESGCEPPLNARGALGSTPPFHEPSKAHFSEGGAAPGPIWPRPKGLHKRLCSCLLGGGGFDLFPGDFSIIDTEHSTKNERPCTKTPKFGSSLLHRKAGSYCKSIIKPYGNIAKALLYSINTARPRSRSSMIGKTGHCSTALCTVPTIFYGKALYPV